MPAITFLLPTLLTNELFISVMLGHEFALKKELLKTISSSTFKKEKEREGGNLVCVLRYEKKKGVRN